MVERTRERVEPFKDDGMLNEKNRATGLVQFRSPIG